ncbi:hypothetical protein D9M71_657250 [compost metagenome]
MHLHHIRLTDAVANGIGVQEIGMGQVNQVFHGQRRRRVKAHGTLRIAGKTAIERQKRNVRQQQHIGRVRVAVPDPDVAITLDQ